MLKCETPPKFAGRPPVNPEEKPPGRRSGESRNPESARKLDPGLQRGDELFVRQWKSVQGLAEDGRYYSTNVGLHDKVANPTYGLYQVEIESHRREPR